MKDIFEIFRLIYYPSFVFGTIPLHFKGKSEGNAVATSILGMGIAYAYLAVTCVHGLWTVWMMEEQNGKTADEYEDLYRLNNSVYSNYIDSQSSSVLVMKTCNPLVLSFMSLGSHWIGLTTVRRHLSSFLLRLNRLDKGLVCFSRFFPVNDYLTVVGLLATAGVLAVAANAYFVCVSVSSNQTFSYTMWVVLVVVNNLSSYTSELQFLILALCLKWRFTTINRYLGRLGQTTGDAIFRTRFDLKHRKLSLCLIQLTHDIVKRLCDLMESLNEIYGFQLFLSITGCFIKILINLYFALFTSAFYAVGTHHHFIKTVVLGCFYIARFLVLTVVSSGTSAEAQKTKILVAKLIQRTLDSDVKEELKIFFRNASSRTLKFSARGLFNLQTSLITSAFASATTYLVVLIQFRPQLSSENVSTGGERA